MKLIYVAGPFNGTVERNIREVEDLARRLVAAFPEAQPVVPHSLGRVLFGAQSEERAYAGTLLLMSVCHALLLTRRWRESRGATQERAEALRLGLPVFEEHEVFNGSTAFETWLAESERSDRAD